MRLVKLLAFLLKAQYTNLTVWKVFEKLVVANPSAISLIHEEDKWSRMDVKIQIQNVNKQFLSIFSLQVSQYSNKVANYFLHQGYKKGDIVAIFMENRPEYMCIWLGLSKVLT